MNKMNEMLKNFPKMENGACLSRLDGVLFFQETEYIPVRSFSLSSWHCHSYSGTQGCIPW